ncbi:MAG TPA: anhydro-N-acetylmuramic acid kinase, partial [Flavobacterium sp.]|nr:anhydro-N-acetylmuramic acid kinase [Flavobacterium sp.]
MSKESYKVVGVMSGTSLDGIDLAHLDFSIEDGKWSFKVHECETIAYPKEWLNKLKIAVSFSKDALDDL